LQDKHCSFGVVANLVPLLEKQPPEIVCLFAVVVVAVVVVVVVVVVLHIFKGQNDRMGCFICGWDLT